MENNLVSVIISTYNKYEQLLCAIFSVSKQTYKNIEIIIIDDNSSDLRYEYLKDIIENEYGELKFKIIYLGEKNSRKILGFPSCGYVRNFGFKVSSGKYIAILDDDDYWLPNKIKKQVEILEKTNLLACSTDGYITFDIIKKNNNLDDLKIYNKEYYWNYLSKKLNLKNDYPELINKEIIDKHNIIICSSTMFNRKVFKLIGYMMEVQNWKGTKGVYQDWDYWKKISIYSDIYYLKEPHFIYYKK